MKNADITVVIPTLGNDAYIHKSLTSVCRQTAVPSEIILVVNHPTKHVILPADLSACVHRAGISLRILRSIRSEGASGARNLGLRQAKNSIVYFMDDDCVLDRTAMKEIIRGFAAGNAWILQGRSIEKPKTVWGEAIIDMHYVIHPPIPRTKIFLYRSSFIDSKNVAVVKKHMIRHHLFFDISLPYYYEDVDISIVVNQKKVPILYAPRVRSYHYPRVTFAMFIKKCFLQGIAYRKLQNKWKTRYRLQLRAIATLFSQYSGVQPLIHTLASSLTLDIKGIAKRLWHDASAGCILGVLFFGLGYYSSYGYVIKEK